MKSIIYACVALVLYATQNVVLEQKLAKCNTFSLLVLLYSAMLPLAIAGYWFFARRQGAFLPPGNLLWITLLVGVVYFFADAFFISAYTSGGNLIAIATIAALFPVFASVVKYLWVGGLPNRYQIIGYLFAAIAVIFMAKGQTN
ncbi:MAG: EamA family transporter [bacterium]